MEEKFLKKYDKEIRIGIAAVQIIFMIFAGYILYTVYDFRAGFEAGKASVDCSQAIWRP